METITLADRPDLLKIIKFVDPKFRKKKAFLMRPRNEVALSGTYHDGGTRSLYYVVNTKSGNVTPCACFAPPQFGGPTVDPMQKIAPGFAVVEMGTFCGKPATPSIYFPVEE